MYIYVYIYKCIYIYTVSLCKSDCSFDTLGNPVHVFSCSLRWDTEDRKLLLGEVWVEFPDKI